MTAKLLERATPLSCLWSMHVRIGHSFYQPSNYGQFLSRIKVECLVNRDLHGILLIQVGVLTNSHPTRVRSRRYASTRTHNYAKHQSQYPLKNLKLHTTDLT
jgi:hypothetical protein